MTRAVVTIRTQEDRDRVCRWAKNVAPGTRVEFRQARRSLPQNDRLHAMLRDISEQAEHFGRKYPLETWKALMLHAFGREAQFVPSLDGADVVPIGQHSSDLSKAEMAELMEFIAAWCAQNGVVLHDDGRWNDEAQASNADAAA